ncbi:MAG: hypothetical protein GF353_26795 [Candidatus Lokiarchaeota archaeon]|nr:hypothetical protein [Candidatus Lokiarchaeota archaeon]
MFDPQDNKIHFINIASDDLSLFDWKPPRSFKSFLLDLNIVKKNEINDIFFHINKGNMKIVYIRKNNLIYTAGASKEIQYQILEAMLEYLDQRFNEIYDVNTILSYGNTNAAIFKAFKSEVEEMFENFKELDLIKKVSVFCRGCNKTLPLFIKKSVINTATSFPVPIVYNHSGHAIVCYVDKNFVVRGVELVNITG